MTPSTLSLKLGVLAFLCPLLLSSFAYSNDIVVHKNENSGLLTWTVDRDGFSIELIQLLPDFVRAIYAKHGFSKKELERIAGYCVFGTIIKNTSTFPLSYKVSDWRYKAKNITHEVKTKSQWLEEWRKAGITFSWTLLPDTGLFEVGAQFLVGAISHFRPLSFLNSLTISA